MKLDLHGFGGRAIICGIVGTLLLVAAVGLIAVTVREQLTFRMAANQHGGHMVDLGANAGPQAGQNGDMARIVGTPRVVEAPLDQDFNLHADTPRLTRHVEMFRWRKISVGDGAGYDLDWVEQSSHSDAEKLTGRHANPPFPIKNMTFDASLVQLGGFDLSPVLLHALPGSEPVAPMVSSLPPNLAASFSRYKNYLVTGEHPSAPALGDIRISWTRVPLQPLTVFARIDGNRLAAAPDAPDGRGYEVAVGTVSALNLSADLPIPPRFVWINRIASVLLATLGLLLLDWSRRRRHDVLLALALGSLIVGAVAAIMWMGYGPKTMTGWLVLALLGLGVAIWRLRGGWRPEH